MAVNEASQQAALPEGFEVTEKAEQRFSWGHEEWAGAAAFETADEFEDWLNQHTSYYIRANAGFYAQCVIVCVETRDDQFLAYVDYYKGHYPPYYTPEEMVSLDIDELRKERAQIKWEDWEWTTLRKEDFPLVVKEVTFIYPPQDPVMPWLFLAPEESGLAEMEI